MGMFFPCSNLFAADQFIFKPPSPTAGTYQVNNTHTYTVAALSAGVTDFTYNNHPVTVGLYNTVNPPLKLSDPGVTIVGNGVTYVGSAPLSFINGLLTFQMTYEAGSDSEQVYLQDSGGTPVTVGNTYPGVFAASIGGAALTIQGFRTNYFLEDANLDTVAASYPVSTDLLIDQSDTTTVDFLDSQVSDQGVTVPLAGGVTGISGIDTAASSYAITNVSGGYAAGGQIVLSNLYFQKSLNTSSTPVSVEVILDYDGTLANYNNPRTNVDTVYLFSAADISFPNYHKFNPAGAAFSSGGFTSAPFKPFITGGQIIVRIWGGNPTNRIMVKYEANTFLSTDLSSVNIPYSTKNVSPVKATISPSTVLSSNPVALSYIITNQYSSALTQILYRIPPNLLGGIDWNFTSVTSPIPGHAGSSAVVTSNPVGTSAPGTITVNFTAGAPVTVNEAVTLTMTGTSSSESSNWPVSLLSALSSSGPAPTDSTQANVRTLGVPAAPGGFTAAVTNFINGGGGSVSLSWTQPSNSENPTGYIISGGPNGPVTLPFSTVSYVDSPVANLTGYTYTIKTVNQVAQSPAATANPNPATAYANPAAPTALSALTGGTNVQLNWTAPVSVSGSYPVTGIQVYRGTATGTESPVPIASISSGLTTFNDTPPVSAGTTYFYYLSSEDNQYSSGPPLGSHDSGPSNETNGFPPGNPPAGVAVTLSQLPDTLHVNWSAPPNVLNTPITNYVVFRSVNAGAYAAYATVGGAILTFGDTSVVTGNSYNYFVKALDSLSAVSNASTTVTGRVGPSAPATPVAVASSLGVTLTWTVNNPVENVTNYVVVRSPGGSSPTGGPASFLDNTAAVGTNYSYYVMAVNNSGVTGLASTTITSARLPLAPSGLTVAPDPVTPTTFNLNWSSSAEANLTGYKLYRGTTSSFPPANPVTIALPVSTSYVDPGLSSGTTYFYFLQELNIGGAGPTISAGQQVPPKPPLGVAAVGLSGAVSLNWTSAPVSEHVSSYTVYGKDLGPPAGGFVSLGTSAANNFNFPAPIAGHDYQFYLTATNPGGGGAPGGIGLASVTISSARLPSAPAGLTVLPDPVTPSTFNLNWNASTEANMTGYKLYRGTTNAFPPANPVTISLSVSTSYVDPGLSAGTTYFYFLQGLNIGGAGPTISAGQQAPPKPPLGLAAVPLSASVSLNWNSAPASENVSSYTVFGRDVAGGVFGPLGSPAGNSFNDTTVQAGHDYQYYVKATNPGGGGVPGGTGLASVTINSGRLAGAPAGFVVSGIAVNNDISTAWTNVTGTEPNATSLDILVGTTANNPSLAVTVNLTPATTTAHLDSGKTPATFYYYWLRTNNPYGSGVLAGPVSQLTYPSAPVLSPVVLAADGISRILTWTTQTYASQYQVYRELQGTGNFILMQTYPASVSLPVTLTLPVQAGKVYDYKIAAVNTTGVGPDSNIQSIDTLPSAPVSVTAVSGINAAVTQVDVAWADPGAASEGVTAFTVYRATDNSAIGNFTPLVTGNVPLSYSDTAVVGTNIYYYIVAADDNAGQETKLLLANSVAVTAYAAPNQPLSPSAAAATGSVTLSWTGVSPTTYPVSIYSITRVGGGVTTALSTAGTTYPDTGLTNGVTYVYFIQTMDNQGHLSVPSVSVTGLPLVKPGPPINLNVASGDQALQITWQAGTPGTFPIGSYQIFRIAPGPVTALLTTLGPGVTGYLDNSPPLSNGSNYSYWMDSVDTTGIPSGLDVSSNTVTLTQSPIANNVNPPGNITAAAGIAQVAIAWTDSVTISGAATVLNYNIIQSTSAAFSSATTLGPYTPATGAVTNTGLSNGVTYFYYLVANSATTVSSNSATVFGIPSAPPGIPAPVAVIDGSASVTLNWTAPSSGSVSILNYYISRTINPPAAATTFFTAGPVTTYSDIGGALNNSGLTVVYQVGAINSNNTAGALSASVTGYPYASFAPTGLASSASNSAVTLNWTFPVSPTWPVTQFAVIRTPAGGGTSVTILSAASPLADTTAAQGQLYDYTILAMDDKGHLSGPSNSTLDGPALAPAAPTTMTAAAGDTQILLDWPASVPATGEMPVSYYLLTGTDGLSVTVTATQTWYLDSPLADPTTVTYTVTAVDISGQASSPVHISVGTPSAPATTSGSNFNPPTALAVIVLGNTALKLTWTQPNDMGRVVTSYNIYRAGVYSPAGGGLLVNIPNPALAPVTAYTDSGLNPSTTYYYVVRAVYGPSSTESPNSNHAFGSTSLAGSLVPPVTAGQMAFDANLFLPNSGTKLGIYYNVPNDGVVEIDIYNISGNVIATLVPGMTTGNTTHTIFWDGKDRNGNTVASGLYLIEIRATGFHQVKKVAVVK